MTGYGRGEATGGDITVLVELRSVNNRFRDLQVRSPREYMPIEPRINKLLKDRFQRGRIEAFIRRSFTGGSQVVVADALLAAQYAKAIDAIREKTNIFGAESAPMTFVLSQPGVLTVTEAEVELSREWPVVETAIEVAIDDLISMREAEGGALQKDLEEHLRLFRRALTEIESVVVGINDRLKHRLDTKLRRLIGDKVDSNRLAIEAAILADKADVSEELARLRSHCEQFREGLQSHEPIGRRMDFLVQEMHREVNTIGSKAAEHPVSQRVVDMKSLLERMREQSANVE
jgi:uncharacterized protein (TIGR00255 family)